jgi:hypothetical protein
MMKAPSPELLCIVAHHLYPRHVVSSWSHTKLDRMRSVLQVKFSQHADLRELLLSTGDARLVEDSPDSFWGAGKNGQGKNWLGVMLVELRDQIRHTGASPG